MDNLSTGCIKEIQKIVKNNDRISFFKGDITNKIDVAKCVENCDYLVNLAAQTNVIASIENPFCDEKINIQGILNLLEASVSNNVERFIHASSAAAVGDQKMPVNELKVPRPMSPYGASKLAGEAYCSAYSNSYNLKCIALRFSNVYGPNSYYKGSVIAKFIKKIIKGDAIELYGNGNQTRDFIHVKDICLGIYLSLIANINNFELIQLGTGIETKINILVNLLENVSKDYNLKFPKIIYRKQRLGEIYKNYTDITKSKNLLSFSPRYNLRIGLKDTFDWFFRNFEMKNE